MVSARVPATNGPLTAFLVVRSMKVEAFSRALSSYSWRSMLSSCALVNVFVILGGKKSLPL